MSLFKNRGIETMFGEFLYDAWGKLLNELTSEDDEDLCIAARFIQPKSLSYNNLKLFNGLNMYSYVFNNPIVFSYNKLHESDNDVIQYSNLFINMSDIVNKEQI